MFKIVIFFFLIFFQVGATLAEIIKNIDVKGNERVSKETIINFTDLKIGDDISETENPMIMRAKEKMLYWIDLKEIVEEIRTSINNGDYEKIKELLVKAVPEFNHNNKSAN